METVSVATVKKKLSEYISQVEVKGSKIIINRRSKPVAALICMEDLEFLKTKEQKGGLAEAIGKWKDFDEIEKDVTSIFESRSDDGDRKVSL